MTEVRPVMRSSLQGAKFLLVGSCAVAWNAAAYAALLFMGAHYLIASAVGWLGGVLLSYALNRKYTFRATSRVGEELARYIMVYVLQLIISWAGFILLIEILGFGPFVAYVINVPLVTLVSFVGVKFFAFREDRA